MILFVIIFFNPKVCSDWREIALTIRDKVFQEDEEHLIDIHDVKVIVLCLSLRRTVRGILFILINK